MIAKIKKSSTKAAPKKPAAKTTKVAKAAAPKEVKEKAVHQSSLHRMLTAEGWKRLTLNEE